MARIIKNNKTSTYKKYYYKGIMKIVFCSITAVLGVVLIGATKGLSILLFISLLFIQPEIKHFEIMNVGLKGERITDDILLELPGKYNILSDVIIHKKGGKNQLDHVVVGRNGIFIVETKFHSGIIKGNDKDVKVLQTKCDSSGKPYHKRFLNPTLQVETHIRAVERILELHGYHNVNIVGMVFFSNKNATVKLKSKRMQIFSMAKKGRVKLLRYIKWYRPDNKLSKQEISGIIDILLDKR